MKEIILPVTPDGNDTADFDDATLELLNTSVDKVARVARYKAGNLSKKDLQDRKAMLDLFKDFTARTGHPLCPKDEAVKKQYTEDLIAAGVL